MLSAASRDFIVRYETEDSEMINLILGSIFCGAGAFSPFLLVNDDMEVVPDEV